MYRLESEKNKICQHMQNKLVLVLHKVCPFAQRSWITAIEKGVPFDLKEVSLKDKEEYFKETYKKSFPNDPNSDGKVPILIDGETVLCESDLVSWYLAEKYQTGTQLIVKDPLLNFKSRWLIQTYGPKIIAAFYGHKGWNQKTEEDKQKHNQKQEEMFEGLNKSLVLPYALGENFTMADILLYPWFERWSVLKVLGKKIDPKYERLLEWIKNIQARDSIKQTRQTDEFYYGNYKDYF